MSRSSHQANSSQFQGPNSNRFKTHHVILQNMLSCSKLYLFLCSSLFSEEFPCQPTINSFSNFVKHNETRKEQEQRKKNSQSIGKYPKRWKEDHPLVPLAHANFLFTKTKWAQKILYLQRDQTSAQIMNSTKWRELEVSSQELRYFEVIFSLHNFCAGSRQIKCTCTAHIFCKQ